ncbi:MAG: manganese-dependent inorganic pyrophosphatase [Candidatus Aenigmarchaeota archaeon]|nr:manganese-dependent inorganic pyrophosphatase [Candidatus Aenigmarchaeota archaeon]
MNYTVGHKNPDTDSIISAIAYAEFLKFKGKEFKAARQGELNGETKFVLEKFGLAEPELVSEAGEDSFFLLDHNSYEQSVDGLSEDQILGVIDHHKIELTTSKPIYFHVEPLGCTCTILTKIFLREGFEISKELAGAMLAAILSDTVIFKSATTTEEDKEIAKKLAALAGIENIEEFGIEVKKKKADISSKTARDIITADFKKFETKGIKYAIGQVELVDLSDIKARKQEILNELEKIRQEVGANFTILIVTDIMKEGSELWIAGETEIPEKAFGKLEDNSIWLPGVMSRKKQVVPPIDQAIE